MKNLIRVLFFSPVAYFKGGAERSLLDLLTNPEIEPHVLAPADGPILQKTRSLGIPGDVVNFGAVESVHRPFTFGKGLAATKSAISAVRTILRICDERGIDILHSNGLKAHVLACAARTFGGPPTVVHIRDIPFTGAEKSVWQLLRRTADQMVLVSRACWPNVPLPSNASVVHNGIEVPQMALQPFRPRIPLTIGFIGRISTQKGLHLLLNWMHEAKKTNLELQLIVRGSFEQPDNGYQQQIEMLIRSLKLSNISLEGFVSDADKVYSGIDVVCVPSHVPDPLPRSVMEPMARGIPVIAYPAGGIPEMIEDGATGFIVANANEFLAAIRALMYEQRTIDTIIAAARKRIECEFSLPTLHSAMLNIYTALAKDRRQSERPN
jgi:glycosyltransferase involved in cell wall biosynthesis